MYRINQLEKAMNKEEPANSLPHQKHSSTLEQTSRITPEQRAIITDTFRMMEEDSRRNGINIFVRLFSEFPNYKDIWPQFQGITDSSLMGAAELHKHAVVYMHGLHTIIGSIDDDHTLAEQLRKIAQAHLRWGVRKFHVQ
uniref:Globin family profile domain-containing protein n=1 Tax=Plectus sambesii TaxID=2011161 RepID=A0A914XR98_9BILA